MTKETIEKNSPPSSLEHSLGGPCIDRLAAFKLCWANVRPFALPIALIPLKPSDGWFDDDDDPVGDGPKRGRVKNGLLNMPGTPNCKNGAHGGTPPRFLGAKCAAAAAYSCNAGWRPAFGKCGKPWCSRTIFSLFSFLNFHK